MRMNAAVQDPAGDAGARAAVAGLRREDCPYATESGLGRRWLQRFDRMVIARHEQAAVAAKPKSAHAIERSGTYSPEETRQIAALLQQGKTADEIAVILRRETHSVSVKIGWMLKADLTEEEERILAAYTAEGFTVGGIQKKMRKGRGPIERAIAKLGLQVNRRYDGRRWAL